MEQITLKQIDNFYAKIRLNKETKCWEWQASLDKDSYGWFGTRFGKKAHRFSYFIHYGGLNPNLQIDHLCRNKKCVNPNHLEQVTCKENLRRAENQQTTINAQKTHCKRGHELSGYNLIIKKGEKRNCRICRNMMERIRRKAVRLQVTEVMV